MTAQTPIYHLTYTTGTDRLCDGDAILEELETDYATAFATIAADVDRLTVVNFAMVSANNIAENGGFYNGNLDPIYEIQYDSVDADTSAMVDLGTAPQTIFWNPTTNRTGVWMAGFGTVYTGNHLTYSIIRVIDDNNSFTQTTLKIGDQQLAAGTPEANTVSVNGLYSLTSASASAAMVAQLIPNYDGTTGGHAEATSPHMWMIWMRDPA